MKDVNQSLSKVLSVAVINPTSSMDSVSGYGREGPTRLDSKSNSGYGMPDSANSSHQAHQAQTLGDNRLAYYYQSTNQSQQSKGNVASYPSGQS